MSAPTKIRTGFYRDGEVHRQWPEWAWDTRVGMFRPRRALPDRDAPRVVWVDCSADTDLGIAVIAVVCEGKLLATRLASSASTLIAEGEAIRLALAWIDGRDGFRVCCDHEQAVRNAGNPIVGDGFRGDNQAHRLARRELRRLRGLLS